MGTFSKVTGNHDSYAILTQESTENLTVTQEDELYHNLSLRTKESNKSQVWQTARGEVWVGGSGELQELGLVSQL